MKTQSLLPLAGLALAFLPSLAAAQERAPWTERTLDLFATLPVQELGRVKPLDTYAQFQLLKMNGKRSFKAPDGEKMTPTPWLLDCLFFPEVARTYRTFHVRDQAVLDAIGVRVEGRKKSDRYSYAELEPGREQLFEEAQRIRTLEEKRRTGLEVQLFALALSMRDFDALTHALEFARRKLPTATTPFLRETFGPEDAGVTEFLERWEAVHESLTAKLDALPADEHQATGEALKGVSDGLLEAAHRSSAVAIFPPAAAGEDEWRFTDGAVQDALGGSEDAVALLDGWTRLERSKNDPAAFESALGALHGRVTALAERRGEYAKVPLEVRFYRGDWFTRALVTFLAGFVCLCASWLAPRARWLVKAVAGLCTLGTLLIVVGVTLRCIIRERPPISTLYETILFVTGTGALVLFAAEWITRRGIALSLLPVWGALGLFLSMKYELKEASTAGDTMPSLVAVLDTNFWLATHVTTITLGYAAGLVAAFLGMRWLISKMVGYRRDDKEHYRALTRMIYGVVCFGLVFSVVGTILGGIWANYSWGRFWGWDPKENGALLICLGELFILHARMGGYVRDFGLAVLAVLNGMAVAFSWWGVNLLSVGLHSYGFTSGISVALNVYYGLSLLVVVAALVWRIADRRAERAAGAAASANT